MEAGPTIENRITTNFSLQVKPGNLEESNSRPPMFGLRLLKWFCPAQLHEGIEGDLLEQFEDDVATVGAKRAQRRFLCHVIKFFRPEILIRNIFTLKLFSMAMIKNDFKTTCRSLLRNKIYTLINVSGFTIGIALCAYILLYVEDELSYDKHFNDSGRVYRISMVHGDQSTLNSAWTPPTFGHAYKENFPEVESFATIHKFWKNFSVTTDDETEVPLTSVYFVNPDFFEIFSFDFLEGNAMSALASAEGAVISQTLAKKIFKGSSPLGKSIQTTFGPKTITGVLCDAKENTHLESPEIVLSIFGYFGNTDILQDWSFDATTYNYIKLKENVSFKEVRAKFENTGKLFAGRWLNHSTTNDDSKPQRRKASLQFQRLTDIHLYSHKEFEIKPGGNPTYVYAFVVTGMLLLIMAAINYMNLATAKSTERTKEIGVRKALGTTRGQLVVRFLTESFLLTLMSVACSFIFLWILMPYINGIAGKSFLITKLLAPSCVSIVLGISLLSGLLGGLYPAFVISGFKPTKALKGIISRQRTNFPVRKMLIVIQFTASIILVAITFVVYMQLQFVNSQDLGFNKEHVVAVELKSPEDRQKITALKNSFETLPNVKSVGLTAQFPGSNNIKTEPFQVEDGEGKFFDQLLQYAFVDENFVPVMELEVVNGRNFNTTGADASGASVIVNELMVKRMGWTDPLGKKIRLPIEKDAEVVGVIKDFHIRSFHDEVQPFILISIPEFANILLVKLETPVLTETLSILEDAYQKIVGEKMFSFTFLDQEFQQQYLEDERRGRFFALFSGVSIFMACIGLVGLLGMTIRHRSKEIGIRRVMGATISNILILLSAEYLMLTIAAIVIASPLSYYLAQQWLSEFAYRIEMRWWMFVLPVIFTFALMLIPVGWQSLRIALLNPTQTLKHE